MMIHSSELRIGDRWLCRLGTNLCDITVLEVCRLAIRYSTSSGGERWASVDDINNPYAGMFLLEKLGDLK